MIIKSKQMFCFGRVSEACAVFWKSGHGTAAHLHFKIHAQKPAGKFKITPIPFAKFHKSIMTTPIL